MVLVRNDYRVRVLMGLTEGRGWIGMTKRAPKCALAEARPMSWSPFFGTADYKRIKASIEQSFFQSDGARVRFVFARVDYRAIVVARLDTEGVLSIEPVVATSAPVLARHIKVIQWWVGGLFPNPVFRIKPVLLPNFSEEDVTELRESFLPD